eukprot:gene1647-12772_t
MYKNSFKHVAQLRRFITLDKSRNPLVITPECTKRIKEIMTQKEKPNAKLRIFIDSGGCSGFTSKFSISEEINPDDFIFEDSVVVDDISFDFIEGIKYLDSLLFRFYY